MNLRKILPWSPVLMWMGLIFFLSHQPADTSNELSRGITEIIIKFLDKIIPNSDALFISSNQMIRKSAHFISYLILGLFVTNALKKNGTKGSRIFYFALLICVFYAMSDEFHQIYIPGRRGQVTDILIDSGGAVVGIGVYLLLSKYRESNTKRGVSR